MAITRLQRRRTMPYLDEDYTTTLPPAIDRLLMLRIMRDFEYPIPRVASFNDGEDNWPMAQSDFFEHIGTLISSHQIYWVSVDLEKLRQDGEYEGPDTLLKFTFLEELSHYIELSGHEPWIERFSEVLDGFSGFIEDPTCTESYDSFWASGNLYVKNYQEPFVLMADYLYVYRWNVSLYNFILAYRRAIELYTEVMGTPPFKQECDYE
jgi:hypothetical protein